MTTRVYIDVDGVINAFDYRLNADYPTYESGWSDWKSTMVGWDEAVYYWAAGIKKESSRTKRREYLIRYAQEVVDSLNEISDLDDVEFVWLTTWTNHAAGPLSADLGINGSNWRVLSTPEDEWYDPNLAWWKSIALREDLRSSGTPDKIIWLDDDIKYYGLDIKPLLSVISKSSEVLVISPESSVGLTDRDISGIIDFINGPQG